MSTETRNRSKILGVDDEPDLELMVRTKFRKEIKTNELEFVFAHNGRRRCSTSWSRTRPSTW